MYDDDATLSEQKTNYNLSFAGAHEGQEGTEDEKTVRAEGLGNEIAISSNSTDINACHTHTEARWHGYPHWMLLLLVMSR